MRSHSQGTTLIEAVIYIALVSSLLAAFISYAYAIHERDASLFDDIESAQSS